MPTTVTLHPPRSFADRYFFFQAEDNWLQTASKIANWLLIIPTFGLNILLLAFYDVWRWDAYTGIDLPPRLPFGLFANFFPRHSRLSGNPIMPIRLSGPYVGPQLVVSPPPYVAPFAHGLAPPPPAMPTPPLVRHTVGRDAQFPSFSHASPPPPAPAPPMRSLAHHAVGRDALFPHPPAALPTPLGQRAQVGSAVGNPHPPRGSLSAQPIGGGLTGTPVVGFPPPGPYPPQAPHMGGAPGFPPHRYGVGPR
jgi:hypothetical protein